ncbi:hypothetical protein NLI96_g9191 [Meripilus lineatus]|uniref:DRBM domain-containing protein n=1 Tax=Meripilus lineatus TaxID=2056292 RepID=A0AAD5UVW9_9APHY|nr:hypothetical protein NLI96_g9191 [Physisporinus lineatus]
MDAEYIAESMPSISRYHDPLDDILDYILNHPVCNLNSDLIAVASHDDLEKLYSKAESRNVALVEVLRRFAIPTVTTLRDRNLVATVFPLTSHWQSREPSSSGQLFRTSQRSAQTQPPRSLYSVTTGQSTLTLLDFLRHNGGAQRLRWSFQTSGPESNPEWTAEVFIDGIKHGEGNGSSKHIAKEQAAEQAMRALSGMLD